MSRPTNILLFSRVTDGFATIKWLRDNRGFESFLRDTLRHYCKKSDSTFLEDLSVRTVCSICWLSGEGLLEGKYESF